jgi:hypothetical protein
LEGLVRFAERYFELSFLFRLKSGMHFHFGLVLLLFSILRLLAIQFPQGKGSNRLFLFLVELVNFYVSYKVVSPQLFHLGSQMNDKN